MDSTLFSKINWRDTARPLRFFIFDARVLVLLLIWACHMRIESFCVAVFGVIFFGIMELMGLTFSAAFFGVKRFLLGEKRRVVWPYFDLRRSVW